MVQLNKMSMMHFTFNLDGADAWLAPTHNLTVQASTYYIYFAYFFALTSGMQE